MRRISELCRGCSACLGVCPRNAIEMRLSEYGFYAAVKTSDCVECGRCSHFCENLRDDARPLSHGGVFACVALDSKSTERSSSGGIGYLLAKSALSEGSKVVGCTYDTSTVGARHVVIDKESDLGKIQGSLYLMSDFSATVKAITSAQVSRGAIFGTPCQVAGIHGLLTRLRKRSDYLLVDIFCHGVPSQFAWERHVKSLEQRGLVEPASSFSFRQKKSYVLTSSKEGRSSYSKPCGQDGFFRLFLEGSIFNEACYSCPYRRSSYADLRLGDIACGDYLKLPFAPSCVIANTKKGMLAFEKIASQLDCAELPWGVVDAVQDKGDRGIPETRATILSRIERGKSPNEICRGEILLSKIKTLVKRKGGNARKPGPTSLAEIGNK